MALLLAANTSDLLPWQLAAHPMRIGAPDRPEEPKVEDLDVIKTNPEGEVIHIICERIIDHDEMFRSVGRTSA